jgi:hypothetical protein
MKVTEWSKHIGLIKQQEVGLQAISATVVGYLDDY